MNHHPDKTFQCGGAVDPSEKVYIRRNTDEELLLLLRRGNHCNLHAGRQAGKTSLMLNVRDQLLNDKNRWCINVDFAALFSAHSLREGLIALADHVLKKIFIKYIAPYIDDLTSKSYSGFQTSEPLITNIVQDMLLRIMSALPEEAVLYLFWDEVDCLMHFPPSEVYQFFIGLRSFLQRPDLHQNKLVLLLVSVLTPTQMMFSYETGGTSINFARDVPLSPFDNTLPIRQQLREQAFSTQNSEIVENVLTELLNLTGGQPFLTSLIGQELQNSQDLSDDFKKIQDDLLNSPNSIARGHFETMDKELFDMGDRVFSILQVYSRVLRGEAVSVAAGRSDAAMLENIALLKVGCDGNYQVANPIYKKRFGPEWIEELMGKRETASLADPFQPGLKHRSLKKRLALILCGGRIGTITVDGHSSFQGAASALNQFIEQELEQIAHIELFPLYQLDSINMTPIEWRGIADLVYHQWDHFDGFVITQGRDTLAYTASAVSFMLGPVRKPVVFTGAQTQIDMPLGDARSNLYRACFAAAHVHFVPEVQVCFGDEVLRAVCAKKKDGRIFQGFDSPAWQPLAHFADDLVPHNIAWLKGTAPPKPKYAPELASRLLLISLVPGLLPEYFEEVLTHSILIQKPLDGIIITTLGTNVPTKEPYNFRTLIQKAVDHGIPVLLSSQTPIKFDTLETNKIDSVAEKYGAIQAGNLTPASLFVKFAWVIGCVNKEEADNPELKSTRMANIKNKMATNYVGEEGDLNWKQINNAIPDECDPQI